MKQDRPGQQSQNGSKSQRWKTGSPRKLGMYLCVALALWCVVGCETPVPDCAQEELTWTPSDGSAAPDRIAPRVKKVLIFTRMAGWQHDISFALEALRPLLQEAGIAFVVSEDLTHMTKASLAQYGAIVLLSTSAAFLGEASEPAYRAFVNFVAEGGGVLGIHAAGSSYGCGDYAKMIGGSFRSHPGNVREVTCKVTGSHPAVDSLPKSFSIRDEIYLFHHFQDDGNVVLRCTSVDGNEQLPIAWSRRWDRGRVFYTALGHTPDFWQDQRMMKDHLLPALRWVLGVTTG